MHESFLFQSRCCESNERMFPNKNDPKISNFEFSENLLLVSTTYIGSKIIEPYQKLRGL